MGVFSRPCQCLTWGDFKPLGHAKPDKSIPIVEIHSCDQIGVNMRLFGHEQLRDVEVQYPNGSAWSGKGPFEFRREPTTLNPDSPW